MRNDSSPPESGPDSNQPIPQLNSSSQPTFDHPANGNRIQQVSIPNIGTEPSSWPTSAELETATEERLRLLSRAVASDGIERALGQSLASQDQQKLHGRPTVKNNNALTATNEAFSNSNKQNNVRPFWQEDHAGGLERRLKGVVDSILEQYPIVQPRSIIFTGIKNENLLDEITAEVARLLARRRIGRILLIDANIQTGALSHAAGAESSAGLLEAIHGVETWQTHLQTGAPSGLEFLPLGQPQRRQIRPSIVGDMLKAMAPYYQFTCVSVGNYNSEMATVFANQSDGSFLLIDMLNASQTIAQKAVDQLNSANSKLLGCIGLDEQ
jgi:Mrp family chromosome partitioning ATPase